MSDQNRGSVRAGWRGQMQKQFAMPGCAHAEGKACLRRIQIAERNEAEREQAGRGRVVTRSEVK